MANTQTQTGMDFHPAPGELLRSLADNWWLLLLRGIAAIAFGILAFFWPGLTLVTLTLLWGAYALADGVFAIWAAFNASGGDAGPRWWLGLSGVVSILAAMVAFYYTGATTLALLMFIAIWAIIVGILQLYAAIQLRKVVENEWLLVLSGLLSIAFGVIMLVQPATGAVAFAWTIAWYAIFFGGLFVALAFRLKSLRS